MKPFLLFVSTLIELNYYFKTLMMSSNVNSNAGNSDTKHDMFRSTKLWNDVLHAFYAGIPLKKHRKYMKCYNDCFIASDAVQWLHNYLLHCPHFSTQIQRSQALRLIQKYEKSGYIENVMQKKDTKKFEDNKELFRFTRQMHEWMCGSHTVKSPQHDECCLFLKRSDNVLKKVSNDNTCASDLPKTVRNIEITKQINENCLVLRNAHNYMQNFSGLMANDNNELPRNDTLYYGRGFMTVPSHNHNYLMHSSNKQSINECAYECRVIEKPKLIISEPVIPQESNKLVFSFQNLLKPKTQTDQSKCASKAEIKSSHQSDAYTPSKPYRQPSYSLHQFIQTQLTEYI